MAAEAAAAGAERPTFKLSAIPQMLLQAMFFYSMWTFLTGNNSKTTTSADESGVTVQSPAPSGTLQPAWSSGEAYNITFVINSLPDPLHDVDDLASVGIIPLALPVVILDPDSNGLPQYKNISLDIEELELLSDKNVTIYLHAVMRSHVKRRHRFTITVPLVKHIFVRAADLTRVALTSMAAALDEEVSFLSGVVPVDGYYAHWLPQITLTVVSETPPLPAMAATTFPALHWDPQHNTYSPLIFFNEFWTLKSDLHRINESMVRPDVAYEHMPLDMLQCGLSRNLIPTHLVEAVAARLLNEGVERLEEQEPGISEPCKFTVPPFDPFEHFHKQVNLSIAVEPMSIFKAQLYLSMMARQTDWYSSEVDSMKEMLGETHPALLALTFTVMILHTVFSFLAVKSDVSFWKDNKDMTGLSLRTVAVETVCSVVIFLYLLDNETSMMILGTEGVATIVQFWKLSKATRITFDPATRRFVRLPAVSTEVEDSEALTAKYDAMAMKYVGGAMVPVLIGYTIYALLTQKHKGLYSFVLETAASSIFAFGFVLMTPQLFINYQLKSVAHMPWRQMTYKFLTTIVDDCAIFVIKMPTLRRLACFRDDIIFALFLYQRWCFRVDPTRVNEYGTRGIDSSTPATAVVTSSESAESIAPPDDTTNTEDQSAQQDPQESPSKLPDSSVEPSQVAASPDSAPTQTGAVYSAGLHRRTGRVQEID